MRNRIQKVKKNSVYLLENDGATFTCDCIEPVTLLNKFNNSYACAHPFCRNCIISYIQVKLDDNVLKIKCRATTCNHYLEPLSTRPKITPQLFNNWCDALYESRVNRVYCPNRKCSELITNECGNGDLRRYKCPSCHKPFCFWCKVPWHDGSTCEENKHKQDEYEVALDVLYQTNIWRCPRCGHFVEHVNGRNVILLGCRCTMKSFCFKCGKHDCYCYSSFIGNCYNISF